MADVTYKSKRMSQQQRYNAAKKAGMSDEKALYESTRKTTGKPSEKEVVKRTRKRLSKFREALLGKRAYAGRKTRPSIHQKYAGNPHKKGY